MKSDIKTPIPPLNVDDTVFYSEQEKANAFNDFFVSQTKLENNNQECPLPPVYSFREHLTDIELNTGDIRKILQSLPLMKAVGTDQINNRVMRELSLELAEPLCQIFNKSLRDSIPYGRKQTYVLCSKKAMLP